MITSKLSEKFNILLIDDDESSLMQSKSLIENVFAECEVIAISSTIGAMDILFQKNVDIVMASTEMRFINGFRLIDIMKNSSILRDIPIFLMTASKYYAAILEIERSEATGAIRKPLTKESIEPMIRYLNS